MGKYHYIFLYTCVYLYTGIEIMYFSRCGWAHIVYFIVLGEYRG